MNKYLENDLILIDQRNAELAVEIAEPKIKVPKLYDVILLNDDFTPMDFVVGILMKFFNLGQVRAIDIMLQVHTRGKGVCGRYTREIAETKVALVNEYSQSHEYPLLCTMEVI